MIMQAYYNYINKVGATNVNMSDTNVQIYNSIQFTSIELSSPEQAVMVGSIVGGVIGACFVIVLIFIVCICCMRRKRQQKSTTFNHEVEALQSVDQKHPTVRKNPVSDHPMFIPTQRCNDAN